MTFIVSPGAIIKDCRTIMVSVGVYVDAQQFGTEGVPPLMVNVVDDVLLENFSSRSVILSLINFVNQRAVGAKLKLAAAGDFFFELFKMKQARNTDAQF